jgi:hypothetical protein
MAQRPPEVPEVIELSDQEVVDLVDAWLSDEANLQSLKTSFDDADRLAKDLSNRSKLPAKEPLRVLLGGARADAT